MASQAVKEIKFGFWVGAGFVLLGLTLSIIMGLSMWALGSQR